jgi:hypothetical protein
MIYDEEQKVVAGAVHALRAMHGQRVMTRKLAVEKSHGADSHTLANYSPCNMVSTLVHDTTTLLSVSSLVEYFPHRHQPATSVASFGLLVTSFITPLWKDSELTYIQFILP